VTLLTIENSLEVAPVVSQSEAFDLLRRWKSNETELRVRAEMPEFQFDFMASVKRVDEPIVGLDLKYRGYVEFRFDGDWGYDFTAPASSTPLEDRVGESSGGSRQYEFGEMVAAVKADHSFVIFIEVVKPVE
jgi:hypothetical protein